MIFCMETGEHTQLISIAVKHIPLFYYFNVIMIHRYSNFLKRI